MNGVNTHLTPEVADDASQTQHEIVNPNTVAQVMNNPDGPRTCTLDGLRIKSRIRNDFCRRAEYMI